jgi:fatty acid synthase
MDSRPEDENIWLIAEDSPANGIVGLVNCLRKEPNGHRIRCILDYELGCDCETSILNDKNLISNIVKKDLVMNIVRNHCNQYITGSFRHFIIDSDKNLVPAEHCYLNVQTRGDLSSFKWFEAQHKYWPICRKDNQELIRVHYAPLNFRDIMLATGKLCSTFILCMII